MKKENLFDDFGEELKYRKKRHSSTSNSFSKSKHKHDYKQCLFDYEGQYYLGSYCVICGKVGTLTIVTDENHRMLSSDEVRAKYSKLEIFELNDLLQKFIPVVREIQ